MKTRTLFYEDPYLREFEAEVLSCDRAGDGYRVILDRTAFYPEGGGQPADLGRLDDCPVTDVIKEEDAILHICSEPLTPGQVVHGSIDWDRRFDLMQQHSGEHLVSGAIHEKYGYDNVGFHMGEEMITIDLSGPMDKEGLKEIEDEVNRYIWEDHEARIYYPSSQEREKLPYRSKIELGDEVRLVDFPGGDLCACCGLHVARSGEIGLVKLISARKFHEGVRIEMVSGQRAVRYLNSHWEQNQKNSVLLSARPDRSSEAVETLLADNYKIRGELIHTRIRYFECLARSCRDLENVALILEEMNPDSIVKCTDAILDSCKGTALVLSGDDETGYKFAAGSRTGDVRPLGKTIRESLGGRGGGKPAFIQGMVRASEKTLKDFCLQNGFTMIN